MTKYQAEILFRVTLFVHTSFIADGANLTKGADLGKFSWQFTLLTIKIPFSDATVPINANDTSREERGKLFVYFTIERKAMVY